MPWLERVYQAGALWDALEMGAGADVHCYTPTEFERKRVSLRSVREVADGGLDLLAEDPAPPPAGHGGWHGEETDGAAIEARVLGVHLSALPAE